MSHVERFYVLATFYATVPDDSEDAIAVTEAIECAVLDALEALPETLAGSVKIEDLDSGEHNRGAEARWS